MLCGKPCVWWQREGRRWQELGACALHCVLAHSSAPNPNYVSSHRPAPCIQLRLRLSHGTQLMAYRAHQICSSEHHRSPVPIPNAGARQELVTVPVASHTAPPEGPAHHASTKDDAQPALPTCPPDRCCGFLSAAPRRRVFHSTLPYVPQTVGVGGSTPTPEMLMPTQPNHLTNHPHKAPCSTGHTWPYRATDRGSGWCADVTPHRMRSSGNSHARHSEQT